MMRGKPQASILLEMVLQVFILHESSDYYIILPQIDDKKFHTQTHPQLKEGTTDSMVQ